MNKKLMVLLTILSFGLQTNLKANWYENAQNYYHVARWILAEKIKSMNPFGKAIAVEFDEEPVIVPKKIKYIAYKRKYDKFGRKV
jgi:hypothetical protein